MKWENKAGETLDNCVVIHRVTEPYGALSNMSNDFSLTINGMKIRSSEALYQSLRYPLRPDWQRDILDAKHAMLAKMKSKKQGRRKESREDWSDIRVSVMRWVLRLKLAQHPPVLRLLCGSMQHPIVEKSARDSFWGAVQGNDGWLRGENKLGRLFMELRLEISQYGIDAEEKIRVVPAPMIEGLLLLGEPVRQWPEG